MKIFILHQVAEDQPLWTAVEQKKQTDLNI